MAFDRVICKCGEEGDIRYGIVEGNDTIIFIKSGCEGTYDGKHQQYVKMARRIHAARGYSVITADNPADEWEPDMWDAPVIREYAEGKGFADYALMLVGHSDGGDLILKLATQFPQTKKILGINPSSSGVDRQIEKLRMVAQVEKILVYGTKDDEYKDVPALQAAQIENLRILTVEGANHNFTDRTDEFIAQIDLL